MKRLSICYVVPGHDLLSTVGPSRNVLNLAGALSQWADVTVAFRRLAETHAPRNVKLLEIQPGGAVSTVDDTATRGIGYGDFLRYLLDLRAFAKRELGSFDVVLEKSWLLSGCVSAFCRSRGQLGVPVENIVANPVYAARRRLSKRARVAAGRWLAGRALRGAPLIIAETEFLKKEIAQFWRVASERIAVVDLGVDRELFRPIEQAAARHDLGLEASKTVLMYVGVLDYTHDLEPVMRALGKRRDPSVELHVVGNGERADEYRAIAHGEGVAAVFHGSVPHRRVPTYIAAADLCLAPYNPAAFSSGELGYSTMKIPEYLSMGRPVVSVPSGRIRSLVTSGVNGFLFDNLQERWQELLASLPSRERLRAMGEAAASVKLTSWDDTARAYLDLCRRELDSGA